METEALKLPGQDVRKLLAAANGDAALLYLYEQSGLPRAEAMERLKAAAQERGVSLPPIALSPEVRLEKGLAEVEGLDALRHEGTRYILLELPFVPFKNWMTEEIDNIAYRFSLTPVLAHLDRYDWYSRDEVEELLERDDTVFQFNYILDLYCYSIQLSFPSPPLPNFLDVTLTT